MKLVLAALAFMTVPAQAAEMTNLQGALVIEWMVAHCDFSQEHSLGVMVASMTINGSDPQQVQKDRALIRERFTRIATVDEACASFDPPAKARPEFSSKPTK